MLVGSRFRPAVKAVGVADPVGPIHVDAAPLMAPLVLVDVLIGDPQDIQAEAGGPGASRAGGLTQHKVAVGVTVMCRRGGICDAVLRQPPQFRRDAIELLFPAHSRIRGDDLHRGIVGFGELDVRKVFRFASCFMGTAAKYGVSSVMVFRRDVFAMRLTMAAAAPRVMLEDGIKVPFVSLPVRMPARYRRYTAS